MSDTKPRGYYTDRVFTKEDVDRAFSAGLAEGEKLAIETQPAPVQEPSTSYPMTLTCTRCGAVDKGTLTVPNVQRQWVGLTPDDIRLLEKENTVGGLHGDYCPTWDLIEAVEAKLKEKNT